LSNNLIQCYGNPENNALFGMLLGLSLSYDRI
jgi:hypothetical protein